ncbi:MAG: hypothetical protein U9N30_09965, partial [Campylobacterota bacterium]|nr:hypothetical protein [Campylobacterota bacterium]
MMKALLIQLMFVLSMFANVSVVNDAGFVDDITINGREFESLEQETIEFYKEDLQKGKVVIQGLLESQRKHLKSRDLFVEISVDGGDTWRRARGHEEWEFSFRPELGHTYSFSLRITKDNVSEIQEEFEIPLEFNIAGFVVTLDANANIVDGKISGSGSIHVPWLASAGVQADLSVNFSDLGIQEDRITSGAITYNNAIDFTLGGISLHLDSLTFSANSAMNSLQGHLSSTTNGILSSMGQLPLQNISFDSNGIRAALTYTNAYSMDIWQDKGVKVDFRSITIGFVLSKVNGVSLAINDLDADINFGMLLGASTQALEMAKDDIGNQINGLYEWSVPTRKQLISGSNIYFSNMIGQLDLNDLFNPNITFKTTADFSQYGAMFSTLNAVVVEGITISKEGLEASVTADIGKVDIWQSQGVNLEFIQNPTIDLSLKTSGVDLGFSGGQMQLNFGALLNNVKAEVNAVQDGTYAWAVTQGEVLIHDIELLNFHGGLDFTTWDNPEITFDALANMSQYGGLFKSVTEASIVGATISKEGFSAELSILLDDLMIWEDKDVKLTFDENSIPSVRFDVSSSGAVDFALNDFSALLDFGTLLPDVEASMSQIVQEGNDSLYQIGFDASKNIYLLDEKVQLLGMNAQLDLKELDNPKILFNSMAKLNGYGGFLDNIETLSITNASISKEGFSATASADLKDIDIWEEKEVQLSFDQNPSVTLSVGTKVDFALNAGSAKLKFGELLGGAIADLESMQDATNQSISGMYSWSIKGSKKIVSDAKVMLSEMAGSL